MSILSEIQRIQNSKADIKNSIISKGIEVPENSKIDELSTYIDNIEVGEDINTYFQIPTSTSDSYFYKYIVKIPDIDFSSVKSMQYAFMNFSRLNSFKNTSTKNIINFNSTFSGCSSIQSIEIDTRSGTNFNGMFNNCSMLYNLSELDLGKAKDITNLFGGNSSLVLGEIGGFKDLGKSYTQTTSGYSKYTLDLKNLILNHNQILNIINKLYDLNLSYNVASGGTLYRQKIILYSSTLASLSNAEKKIATDKGWDIS